ncbi:hypothetical protein UY456_23090 [Paenibacillus polymyxa]|uniref:hypothetical protein n=1 Tax=Paenibacillus polymyxa TaxID=1406 RepID=UPI002AB32C64|nr:hypothetical protein [Paenibacillus polymyxa]MDY8095857.1 hypothetical protein [Paenibacillus polymyxa]
MDKQIKITDDNQNAIVSLKDGKLIIEVEATSGISIDDLEKSVKAYGRCEGCGGAISYLARVVV